MTFWIQNFLESCKNFSIDEIVIFEMWDNLDGDDEEYEKSF